MKALRWDPAKDRWLRAHRKIGFEQAVFKIDGSDVLDVVEHPNKKRYPNQRIFILDFGGYAYLVPFVETEDEVFLKTIIPSRQATKRYLKGE